FAQDGLLQALRQTLNQSLQFFELLKKGFCFHGGGKAGSRKPTPVPRAVRPRAPRVSPCAESREVFHRRQPQKWSAPCPCRFSHTCSSPPRHHRPRPFSCPDPRAAGRAG